jgi:phosphatidate phosphatase LPIN
MLDAWGYKSSDEDTKQLDALAHQIFRDKTDQENLDTLIGHDQNGNLWIYASEEAKQFAESRSQSQSNTPIPPSSPFTKPTEPGGSGRAPVKALTQIISSEEEGRISRAESEPVIPTVDTSKPEEGYSYAKTLRLTSKQLVQMSKSTPDNG